MTAPAAAIPEAISGAAPVIAYVTGEYPKVSHTFIQREIFGLRNLGAKVITCSVRQPAARTVVGPDQVAENAATFGILRAAKSPTRLLQAHGRMIARRPSAWVSALRLAWKTRPPGAKALLRQLAYFAEAGVLADYLLAQGAGHLHNHFGDSSGSLTMIAAEMAGLPFSITLHGPTVFFEPFWWRLDEKIARAAFIACISHYCRSQAMLFSDEAHWPKLKIIRCGVVPERYERPHGPFGPHAAFVGRLDAVKGVPLLLEAFARVLPRHPGARLTIAGDGPARARLESRVQALGIAPSVSFAGYLDEAAVADLLTQADLLALPSFAEGLPVVLMEAMAAGLPVIATMVAGVPELVQDGISGFIVPPGDVETLTDRLDRLFSAPALCAQMGTAGRSRVRANHDIARETAWMLRCFQGHTPGYRPEEQP